MELREGYKNTEVGVIPEDWDVTRFEMIADKNKKWSITGGPFGSNLKVSDYASDGVQIVQLQNIGDGNFIDDYQVFTSEEKANELLSCNIYPNEIIISKMGDPVARACFIPNKAKRYLMASDGIRLVVNEKEFSKKFIHDYINSVYFRKRAFENSRGSTRLRIGLPELKNLYVIKPNLAEQTAIATALSDADALINSLEKLIAKKRNIKQGAMQKLLQPKDDWEVNSIFELAENKKELFNDGDWIEAEYIIDKGIRLIQTGNIGIGNFLENENKKYISEDSFFKLKCKELKVGDLLICRLAEPAGRSCILPSIGDERVITSVDVTIFRPNVKKVNRLFLNQIFSTSNWFNIISDLCGGTTHKRISRGTLGMIKIELPKIEEQKKIATILSDMDAEISALETKLDKYRKVKLGMMQNLLTGRIRLI